MFKTVGWAAMLCGICCAAPLLWIGAGLNLMNITNGFIVIGVLAIPFSVYLFRKKKQSNSCKTSCNTGCGCNTKD